MAATTVMTQSLQPAGTYYSSSLPWQTTTGQSVTANVLMQDQDAGNASNHLTLSLELSYDGGKTFDGDGSIPWDGAVPGRNGAPWSLPALQASFLSSGNPPDHVRIRIDLPQALSVGATLSFA